ncbi:hypothetical protein [Selenomonas bovis]|uniref:hypothetical protein n=1 Tax=Selenomonas bovis TaxID=416586 RepID=UPI003AB921B9
MPMEAGAVGVRPTVRPQAQNGVDGVTRRESEGSSDGFRPQTNVAIKSAINDMAGVLSKIATNENEAVAEMPQDLQKVLQNVLKNAFSFDKTLSEGLGSTMESQRFSTEQLASVARTLTQMATLAENGYDIHFSDGLQVLLTNLKDVVTSAVNGSDLEPVLILKESFELLNGKEPEELPQALQDVIAQLKGAQTSSVTTQSSNFSNGLQQLIRYFMPQKKTSQPSDTATKQQPDTTDFSKKDALNQTRRSAKEITANATQTQKKTNTQITAKNSSLQMNESIQEQQGTKLSRGQTAGTQMRDSVQEKQGRVANQGQTVDKKQAESEPIVNTKQPQPKDDFYLPEKQYMKRSAYAAEDMPSTLQQESPKGARSLLLDSLENSSKTSQGLDERQQITKNTPLNDLPENHPEQMIGKNTEEIAGRQITAREAREFLMQQPFENSPHLMSSLKDAASHLLQEGTLSPAEAQALQRFVEGQGQVLSSKEARQIETLLRLCQQNIPATVQQAAIQQDLPELPRLWAFMQLCDLAVTKRMNARQLKKAGQEIADFATSMRSAMEGDHAIQLGQRSMNFMMPLYLGENEHSYPTYIHVYDETQADKETGALKKETWLRLCVLTDHLGAVELTCRVYDREHLDLRLFFAGNDTAQQFRSFVPEIRRKLRNSKLHLEDIAIGAAND